MALALFNTSITLDFLSSLAARVMSLPLSLVGCMLYGLSIKARRIARRLFLGMQPRHNTHVLRNVGAEPQKAMLIVKSIPFGKPIPTF